MHVKGQQNIAVVLFSGVRLASKKNYRKCVMKNLPFSQKYVSLANLAPHINRQTYLPTYVVFVKDVTVVCCVSGGPVDVSSSATPSSTTSSSQHLATSLPELSVCQCCGSDSCSPAKQRCTRWSLNSFARNVYAPVIAKTAFKVL